MSFLRSTSCGRFLSPRALELRSGRAICAWRPLRAMHRSTVASGVAHLVGTGAARKSARQHARRRWCQASTAGRIRSAKRAPPHRRSTTAWPPSLGHTVHLCTRPLSPARSVLLEAAAAHLQCCYRAADSDLTLRSHPKHRRLPRRLRKRCVRSCTRAELSHSGDVPHRGARQAAFGRLRRRRARP